MPGRLIIVKVAYDPEARVWYVEDSDLPGVNAEAPTPQELRDKLPGVIADLLEEAGESDVEVPIEIIAHMSASVRLRDHTA
jgi:predicted RNase H-like HicB family nuclease